MEGEGEGKVEEREEEGGRTGEGGGRGRRKDGEGGREGETVSESELLFESGLVMEHSNLAK